MISYHLNLKTPFIKNKKGSECLSAIYSLHTSPEELRIFSVSLATKKKWNKECFYFSCLR